MICLLSLPSLLLLLRICWVLLLLSTTLCWPCSSDLCFHFSSSWASVPWACSCGVLFSGSVGVPLTCYVAPFPVFEVFCGFRLCSFCRSAASPCVVCICRFSPLLSLLLVSMPCLRLPWFVSPRCLQCLLSFISCLTCCPSLHCGLCRLEGLWPLPTPA